MGYVTHPPLGSTKMAPPIEPETLRGLNEMFPDRNLLTRSDVIRAYCILSEGWDQNVYEDIWTNVRKEVAPGKDEKDLTKEDWQKIYEKLMSDF